MQSFLTGLPRSGARPFRRSQADHWSFLFSQIAVYSFVVACVSGLFLVFFFKPGMTGVIYHGSYHELNDVRMSEAYKSTLDISFEVRGGLLMRQIHHWAALIFVAAVCLQLLRLFFTGAFRRPRWLNWLIWVTLLTLGMAVGWTGTILPDDMLSSGSLDVLRGVLESIPVVGSHLMLWIFGGDVPGHRIIPRLYWLHMLLPVAMAGLLVLRRWLVRRRGHTRFPGPAGSRRPGSLRNVPAAAGVAMFFITCGVLALAGALAQISPIWLYGPYQPGSMSAGAAPDWYMGFLDGALRIMPGWELNVAGHPLTLAVLVPGLIVPGAFFTLLASYPLLESRLTGDRGVHHFLDRPRDAATRTAVGTAGITFYGLLWAASSNDQIAAHIGLDLYAVTWFFRLAVLAGPLLAYILTQRICLGLTRREEEETKHGRETGRIVLNPDGGFSEITEPVRPVREDSPGSNLPPAGQGVPAGRGHPDLDRRAALGRWPAGEIRRAVAPRATAHRPLPGPGAAGGAGRLRAAPGGGRRTTRVAYTALGWVVLFFAFHVYWYLGGSFGSPGKLPGGPHSLVAWIVDVLVAVAFPLGAFVCLAIARGWARGRLALAAAALVWSGCVLLLLRGGAGVLDDLSRAAGLLPNGITGLSLTETAGAANASAYVVWSGRAIDAYFLAGGIIFWFLAVHYGGQQAHSRRRRSCGRAADPRPGPRWPAAVLPGRHHPGHGRTHLGPETVRGRPETSRET